MNTKHVLWIAGIALATFIVVQRVPQIRAMVYGVPTTPPKA